MWQESGRSRATHNLLKIGKLHHLVARWQEFLFFYVWWVKIDINKNAPTF